MLMKRKDIELFEKLQAQLEGFYNEMGVLSKKSPGDGVNRFKLKFINQILTELNTFLTDDHRPFKDFIIFNEDDLPTNSDVVFMLSQYLNCLEKLRTDNVKLDDYGSWYWVIDGKLSSVQTIAPKKLKEK